MIIYATSKNTGPSYTSDPIRLVYLGTSVKEAEEAVGNFDRYAKEAKDFPSTKGWYSALPQGLDREMIQYFAADGWWYSIEMIEFKEDLEAKKNVVKEAMQEQLDKKGFIER